MPYASRMVRKRKANMRRRVYKRRSTKRSKRSYSKKKSSVYRPMYDPHTPPPSNRKPPVGSHDPRKKVIIQGSRDDMQVRNLGVVSIGKKASIYGKQLGQYHYHNQNQWVMTGSQGFQVVDFPEVLFTRQQLVGDVSDVRSERYRWPDDPYRLNPFRVRPTSTIYPTAVNPTVVEGNENLYIKNVRVGYEFLSMAPVPQYVQCYFLTPNYDTDLNPIETWTSILEGLYSGQTATAFATSVSQLNATSGFGGITQPGFNPYASRDFAKFWKCLKSVKIVLPPGEQANMNFKINIEKFVKRSTVDEIRIQSFLKGISIFPMFICRSGLIGVKTAEQTQAAEVSYGEVKVGVVSNHQITFGAVEPVNRDTARFYPGLTYATVDQQRILDDEDSVIDPTANEV